MKVIVTGGTGRVGYGVLKECIRNPNITSVIALSRRPLTEESISKNPKITTIIHEDFSQYPNELLDQLKGAEACLWCIGGKITDFPDAATAKKVQIDYTLAAAEAFVRTLATEMPAGKKFNFVFCSGMGAERNMNQNLWFLQETRLLKGEVENGLIAIAEKNADKFDVFVVRPTGILPETVSNLVSTILLPLHMGQRIERVAATMAEMALGNCSEHLLEHTDIDNFGREALAK